MATGLFNEVLNNINWPSDSYDYFKMDVDEDRIVQMLNGGTSSTTTKSNNLSVINETSTTTTKSNNLSVFNENAHHNQSNLSTLVSSNFPDFLFSSNAATSTIKPNNSGVHVINLNDKIAHEQDAFWSIACLFGLLFALFAAIYLSKLWRPENQGVPYHIMKSIGGDEGDITNMAKNNQGTSGKKKSALCGVERNVTSSEEFLAESSDVQNYGLFAKRERQFSKPSLVAEVRKIRKLVSNLKTGSTALKAKFKRKDEYRQSKKVPINVKYSRLKVDDDESYIYLSD